MNIYDFDGTIYNGDSTVDFFLFALRRKPGLVRYIPRQAKGFLLYGMGRIGRTELKEAFFSFLRGADAEKLLEPFWQTHRKKVADWYLRQKREDDLVISASPEFLLAPVCRELCIGGLIASEVDPHTGSFIGPNCKGAEKVRRLRAEYGNMAVGEFYSDSKSDYPLAQIASKAFLVHRGTITEWEIKGNETTA